jgi:hypothetical protein
LPLPDPSCTEPDPELWSDEEDEDVDVLDVVLEPSVDVEAWATAATPSEAATPPTTSAERTAAVRRRPASLLERSGVLMPPRCARLVCLP